MIGTRNLFLEQLSETVPCKLYILISKPGTSLPNFELSAGI